MSQRLPFLGRLPSPDERDRNYPMQVVIPARAEEKRTERFWPAQPSLDQRASGTCVGHAWAHYIADGPIENPPVDPYDIYREAVVRDVWPDNDVEATYAEDQQLAWGTSVRAGAQALQERGLIANYLWAFDVEQILSTLLYVGPVVFGTMWYDEMFFPNFSDDYMLRVEGPRAGGHAYVLNGVDINAGYVRVKNSWGTYWGKNGTARMAVEDVDRLLHEQGEAAIAVELDVLNPDDDSFERNEEARHERLNPDES